MDMSVKGEEMEVSRSVPMSETSLSEQDRSQVVLRAMFNGDTTYDNQTGDIQLSRRTTYRDLNHRVAGTRMLSERRLKSICYWGGYPHGGEGDRDANRIQGCIQSASELGLRTGMHTGTAEQS